MRRDWDTSPNKRAPFKMTLACDGRLFNALSIFSKAS